MISIRSLNAGTAIEEWYAAHRWRMMQRRFVKITWPMSATETLALQEWIDAFQPQAPVDAPRHGRALSAASQHLDGRGPAVHDRE